MSAAESIEDMEDDRESWGDDMDEYFGDEYKKAETISLEGIKNFFLKSEIAEVIIEINNKDDHAKHDGKPVSEIFIGIGLHY